MGENQFVKILLGVALILSASIVVVFFIVISPVNQESNQTWYGTYSAEKEKCFRYGGGWSSGNDSCNKGWGAPFNEDGSCPEGHTKVQQTFPYNGDACLETEYVENAECDKYWTLVWNEQGYGCSKMDDDERIVAQNEEIIKNQEYLKELLEDIYDQES